MIHKKTKVRVVLHHQHLSFMKEKLEIKDHSSLFLASFLIQSFFYIKLALSVCILMMNTLTIIKILKQFIMLRCDRH